jgi:hypothetical protein
MSETKNNDNGKRKRSSSDAPKRILSHCMSHDYTLLDTNHSIDEYIRCMNGNDTTQLLDDFILKSRINNILTCRPSRRNTERVGVLWYTTTCYLSSKIIILFFTMLRLFSLNIGVESKSEMTVLWLMVEKMMWEIMTTNSIKNMSDPPSLGMLGQRNDISLGDFIVTITDQDNVDEIDKINKGLKYISSVSRGELDRSENINDISEILQEKYNRIPDIDCRVVNSMLPIISGISISSSGDGIASGIIHWFSFVINNENSENPRIYVYSSWADGDYPIQSIMTKTEVEEDEFNRMINIFTHGSEDPSSINDAISLIEKYFFSNPPIGSKNVREYLKFVFLREDGIIIPGKFQIIMFPYYYKHCINISKLLLQTSLQSPMVRSEMTSVVATSNDLLFDFDLLKLKLLLIFLYTKMGCSNSGFYQREELGIRGGKIKRKRSMKRRKTIKRKRRYTRRYKKRML